MRKLKWRPTVFFENIISLIGTLVIILFFMSWLEVVSINMSHNTGLSWWNYFNVFYVMEGMIG